ncbi:DKNYY domain-containing protein [Bordetella genomosp. 13]|uniref:DKNYY domain-containing protein n=1 Tax=Bordetella genomosp. 13 TaxID=463040 RepID=UPI0011A23DC3|nr:DKNYY domain-containing protein [Bordetella genomosp. 13]
MARRAAPTPPAGPGPILPYDLYVAARFFLATGRSPDDVLPLLGLSAPQWQALHKAYDYLGRFDFGYQDYFGTDDEADILARVTGPRLRIIDPANTTMEALVREVRPAAWANPHIGPFADVPWTAVHIATHPEMTLCFYSHDGRQVYFLGKPLQTKDRQPLGADYATFEWLGGRWLRDAKHVYGQGELGGPGGRVYWYVVEGADPATFQPLNLRYAKDARNAYYITGKTLRTKSPERFEIVPELRLNFRDVSQDPLYKTSVFARDAEHLYFYGARLRGARPTFRDLGGGYGTDGMQVWFHDDKLLIADADVETFRVPVPGEPHPGMHYCAVDRLRAYRYGKPMAPDAAFEAWTAFFEYHSDLHGWWWHDMARTR